MLQGVFSLATSALDARVINPSRPSRQWLMLGSSASYGAESSRHSSFHHELRRASAAKVCVQASAFDNA